MDVLVVAMQSPGGRSYHFSMERTQQNLLLMKNKLGMECHLKNLIKQGLQPQSQESKQQIGHGSQSVITHKKISNNEEVKGSEMGDEDNKSKRTASPKSSDAKRGISESRRDEPPKNTAPQKSGDIQRDNKRSAPKQVHDDNLDDDFSETELHVPKHAKKVLLNDPKQVPVPLRVNTASETFRSGPKQVHAEIHIEDDISGSDCEDNLPKILSQHKSTAAKPGKKTIQKKCNNARLHDFLKDKNLIFDIEQLILEEVLKRPPLFDWTLDHEERHPDLLFRLQFEVANIVAEVYNIDIGTSVVQNTFDHHKGLFLQFFNKCKVMPSGSGANKIPKKPVHYDVLQQLQYLYERRNQKSTLSDVGFTLKPPQGGNKNRNNNNDVDHLVKSTNELINNMKRKPTTPVPAVPPPVHTPLNTSNDAHYSFFLTDFKQLKPKDKREFKINVLGILNGYLDRYYEE